MKQMDFSKELKAKWAAAESPKELIDLLVLLRDEHPELNDIVQFMARNLYARLIKEVKIDEHSLYDFLLNSHERSLLDQLCVPVERYQLSEDSFLSSEKWTVIGMQRLSRSWSESEHITQLPEYFLMDWEQLCGRLGIDFTENHKYLVEKMSGILHEHLFTPHVFAEIYSANQQKN